MAQISKITLPNGSAYDLKGSVYSVIGTQTASTDDWTGTLTALDALYDGLTIAYYLPYAGSGLGIATLNLTLKNNVTTGPKCVYVNNQIMFADQYPAGSVIWLTYFSSGSISIGGTQITSDRWIAQTNNRYSLTKYPLNSSALFATSTDNWVSNSTDYKLALDTVLVSDTILTSYY